jgi:hypothetical protein
VSAAVFFDRDFFSVEALRIRVPEDPEPESEPDGGEDFGLDSVGASVDNSLRMAFNSASSRVT